VDYLNYFLAVLVIGLVCFTTIRLVARRGHSYTLQRYKEKQKALAEAKKAALGKSGKRTKRTAKSKTAAPIHRALHREIQHVRTPWGWPNGQTGNTSTGLSGSMQSLTDRLVREKKLSRTRSNDPRTSNSVRALLEDRYGRVDRDQPTTVEYRKVKKPLLRDPSEPHDQMDNFGVSEAERIRKKLRNVASMTHVGTSPRKPKSEHRYVDIKNIKQPWGW